jgi:MFS family permease
LSDITGKRRLTVYLGLFIFFVASIAMTVAYDLLSLVVVSIVLGIMSGFWISPFYVMIVQLGDPENAGATSSLVNTLTRIGVAIAPVVFGYVVDQTRSYDYAMLTMSFAAALAILFLMPIREASRSPESKNLR